MNRAGHVVDCDALRLAYLDDVLGLHKRGLRRVVDDADLCPDEM